jgi:hypothetical protein
MATDQNPSNFIHAMGLEAKDKVTGFIGIIVARSQHITGCNQYCLMPKIDKEGKIPDGHWIDEGRLEILSRGVNPEEVQAEQKGGPKEYMSTPR